MPGPRHPRGGPSPNGGGEFPASLTALLLCTCRRWSRVTGKLVAAIGGTRFELRHQVQVEIPGLGRLGMHQGRRPCVILTERAYAKSCAQKS
jgi:hypothetical protein